MTRPDRILPMECIRLLPLERLNLQNQKIGDNNKDYIKAIDITIEPLKLQ